MSGSIGVNAAIVAATGLTDLLLRPIRSIGYIIPDVTIDEDNRNDLEITKHPIEYGTPITDHAYPLQAEVTARYGWDNSVVPSMSSLIGDIQSGTAPLYSSSKILDVYNALLSLQASRQPFVLCTGKQPVYQNMLIASLSVRTDATSENALMVTAVFRQITIAYTQAVTGAPIANQAAPQKTADAVNTGNNTATPASSAANSTLATAYPGTGGSA